MPLYKFLSKKYHDAFFEFGSLRLGTVYDFKDIITHSLGRGDTSEGIHHISRGIDEATTFRKGSSEPVVSEIFDMSGEGSFTLSGMTLMTSRVSADGFIFCTSRIFSLDIFKKWHAQYPEIDSCYEIIFPQEFVNSITDKVKNSAFFFHGNAISYAPDPIPYDSHIADVYPAFTKEETQFSWQSEHRMMWGPKGPCFSVKPWVIDVPEARAFCRPYAALENGRLTPTR